jgi:hypothetical protein
MIFDENIIFFYLNSAAKQAKKVKAQQKKVTQPAGLKVNY